MFSRPIPVSGHNLQSHVLPARAFRIPISWLRGRQSSCGRSFSDVWSAGEFFVSVLSMGSKITKIRVRRFFFFIRIHVPPHVRSGLQIFCETKFKTGGKKNVPSSFLPAKMGLNSGEASTRTAHARRCLHTQ